MENLELTTYIIKDKTYSIVDVNRIDTSMFVPIDQVQEINAKKLDPDYLDGALWMKFNEDQIMDFTYWDDIADLWHYFINSFEELCDRNESKFTFPSQPLPVSMEILGNRIRVKIDEKSINMQASYFFPKMIAEAIHSFSGLKSLFPKLVLEYDQDLARIQKIKRNLHEKFSDIN